MVSSTESPSPFTFRLHTRLRDSPVPQQRIRDNGGQFQARTGTITTPHGPIRTPAFIPVATQAAVKAVLPESMAAEGAQAMLANAYHLFLEPGDDILDAAGGLSTFMNWPGPTFTDSGGFQVMSLGSGLGKVIDMSALTPSPGGAQLAPGHKRMARVDDDGVWFRSYLNGDLHRFTPEVSMRVQHNIGADIMFAFDELTTLHDSRKYQEDALERTRKWALRCVAEHCRLTEARADKPYQALFGVIQGAQYEDLRRMACRDLAEMGFDGFGIGGALEKRQLGTIVRWCTEELPEETPKHLLGISEPDDIFTAIDNGVDTFDCVSPTRVARSSAVYSPDGRFNLTNIRFKRDFTPISDTCPCYTCTHYTRAYLRHLFKAKERNAATLASIHNERFILDLVSGARDAIDAGTYFDYRDDFLARYYGAPSTSTVPSETGGPR